MTDRQFFFGLCATCAAITVAPAAIAVALTEQPQQPIAAPAAQYIAPAATTTAPQVDYTHVRDNLNAADTAWRNGLDGCTNVSVAITAAGNPAVFGGPATAEQRQDLAAYAKRCNLRF